LTHTYNPLIKLPTVLLVVIGVVSLIFRGFNLFGEASAAQKATYHEDKRVHWDYDPDNGPSNTGQAESRLSAVTFWHSIRLADGRFIRLTQ
jgi:hypothetical protein